ncbi:MAG: methylated-DNA--[protein]-cysteine S-methyltransferase [Bacteroidaceae bacterium]
MNDRAAQVIAIQYYNSPCGELVLASMGNKLCLCDWKGMPCAERHIHRIARYVSADFRTETSPVLEQAMRQLVEYFAGNRKAFDIPLHPVGTGFQLLVWRALLDIPYGETRSYQEIARSIGNPKGVRAVAQAIGANGIDIFIPCHRVIGSNHSLTGFAGGLDRKKLLLGLEWANSTK